MGGLEYQGRPMINVRVIKLHAACFIVLKHWHILPHNTSFNIYLIRHQIHCGGCKERLLHAAAGGGTQVCRSDTRLKLLGFTAAIKGTKTWRRKTPSQTPSSYSVHLSEQMSEMKRASLQAPVLSFILSTYGWSACDAHEASRVGFLSSSGVEASPWCQAGASVERLSPIKKQHLGASAHPQIISGTRSHLRGLDVFHQSVPHSVGERG